MSGFSACRRSTGSMSNLARRSPMIVSMLSGESAQPVRSTSCHWGASATLARHTPDMPNHCPVVVSRHRYLKTGEARHRQLACACTMSA